MIYEKNQKQQILVRSTTADLCCMAGGLPSSALVVLNKKVTTFGKKSNLKSGLIQTQIALSFKAIWKKSNFLHRLDALYIKSLTF
jgi:hypothetical protein